MKQLLLTRLRAVRLQHFQKFVTLPQHPPVGKLFSYRRLLC